MSDKVSTFSERLNHGMTLKNLKAAELSRRSGVSESMISCYRSGRYEAAQENLQKLAEALNVSIPWLMGYNVPIGTYEFNELKHKAETILTKLEQLTPSQLSVVEGLIDALIN